LTGYNWTITDATSALINTSTDSILTHTFTTDQISPYVICLETASAASCLSETCVTVRINADISVFVPNGFSPNLDFENELFFPVITGSAFENYEFTIFNRWGQVIFSSTTYPEGWDGKFKGEIAPIGVYVYKVFFKEVNSTNEYKFTGHVTLVR
jgi:gliding motility-associated-like protein